MDGAPQRRASRARRPGVEPSGLHRALEALSAAEWANTARCSDAAPGKGAAPPDTIRRCREAAAALKVASGDAAAALDAVRRHCQSEEALAKRLCEVLEVEVSCLLTLGQPVNEGAVMAAIELLRALETLMASQGPAARRSLKPLVLPQLLEFVLVGTVSAWSDQWQVVRHQLLPVREMLFDRRLGLLRDAPRCVVALVNARLRGVLEDSGGARRRRAHDSLEVLAPSIKALYAVGLLAQDITDSMSPEESSDAEGDIQTMKGLQDRILQHLANMAKPSAVEPEAPSVGSGSPEAEEEPSDVLALLRRAGGSESEAEGLFGIIIELCGGTAEMAAKLGTMAEREIQRLASLRDELKGGKEPARGAAESAAGMFRSIAYLLDCLLKLKDKNVAMEDIVRHLVKCILRAAVLPAELRLCIKPFHDVIMRSHVIHTAASELWAQTPGSGSAQLVDEMPQPWWLYAAGCLAVDISKALEGTDAGCETVRKMESLQWSAHFHLSWSGYTSPPTSVQICDEKGGSPEGANSMDQRESQGGESDLEAEVSEDVDSSDTESSSNDRASDLEDFIDLAPEYNNTGLLRQIMPGQAAGGQPAAQAAGGVTEAAAEKPKSAAARRPAAVQEYCASQIVPDWQARCRRLWKRHGSSPPPSDAEAELEDKQVLPSPAKRLRALSEYAPPAVQA